MICLLDNDAEGNKSKEKGRQHGREVGTKKQTNPWSTTNDNNNKTLDFQTNDNNNKTLDFLSTLVLGL